MTRVGKIARLPLRIREELNCRLQDGEPGNGLVEWLNSLPEVQEVLAAEFGGRPVSEQNMSEWKQGGYREWERHAESCALVSRLTEQAGDLDAAAEDRAVSDRLSTLLAVELVSVAEGLLKEASEPRERWQRLREVLQELAQLRREDHRAAQTRIEQERWEVESDRHREEEMKRKIEEMKKKTCAPLWAHLEVASMAEAFGGGETGRKIAAFILEMEYDLPVGSLTRKEQPSPIKPDECDPRGEDGAGAAESESIRLDQTESNPIQPTAEAPLPSVNGS
ncbi:MAG: hypothetical protein AAB676_09845 [Verrucomicrobiota bacterium]|mgnify:CR=1 FL=1